MQDMQKINIIGGENIIFNEYALNRKSILDEMLLLSLSKNGDFVGSNVNLVEYLMDGENGNVSVVAAKDIPVGTEIVKVGKWLQFPIDRLKAFIFTILNKSNDCNNNNNHDSDRNVKNDKDDESIDDDDMPDLMDDDDDEDEAELEKKRITINDISEWKGNANDWKKLKDKIYNFRENQFKWNCEEEQCRFPFLDATVIYSIAVLIILNFSSSATKDIIMFKDDDDDDFLIRYFDLFWKSLPSKETMLENESVVFGGWKEEELSYLFRNSLSIGKCSCISDSKRYSKELFESIILPFFHKMNKFNDNISFSRFVYTCLVIQSRSFGDTSQMMLPIIELMNGQPASSPSIDGQNCEMTMVKMNVIESNERLCNSNSNSNSNSDSDNNSNSSDKIVKTIRNIVKGEELFLEYADCDNGIYLLTYNIIPIKPKSVLEFNGSVLFHRIIQFFNSFDLGDFHWKHPSSYSFSPTMLTESVEDVNHFMKQLLSAFRKINAISNVNSIESENLIKILCDFIDKVVISSSSASLDFTNDYYIKNILNKSYNMIISFWFCVSERLALQSFIKRFLQEIYGDYNYDYFPDLLQKYYIQNDILQLYNNHVK